jgi:hypothetical protein
MNTSASLRLVLSRQDKFNDDTLSPLLLVRKPRTLFQSELVTITSSLLRTVHVLTTT